MRSRTIALLLSGSVGVGCGNAQFAPEVPRGTNLDYSVQGQTETSLCQSPVTPESTCTVTLTARVELGELEGRDWQVTSLKTVVRDGRSGRDLDASPKQLTAEDIRSLAGSNILAAHGRLSIPLKLQFLIGEAPYYIDGPHELQVTSLVLESSATS